MARPSKFTQEVQDKIIGALRVGNTRRASAAAAGIEERTFYNWMAEGEKATKGEFFQFFQAVTRAEAECEVQNVAILKKAATGYDVVTTRTKTKTYTETVNGADGKPLVGKDGKPVTTTTTETEVIKSESREFDWRASLEWLKRRKRADWGDSIDIRKLDDETLLRLLADGEVSADDQKPQP